MPESTCSSQHYVIDFFFSQSSEENHNHLKFVEEIINSRLGICCVPGTYWAVFLDGKIKLFMKGRRIRFCLCGIFFNKIAFSLTNLPSLQYVTNWSNLSK